MKKYGDLICGSICAVIAAAVFVMSVQIGLKESASIGADFLPKIVSVILFVFSVILAVRGWRFARSGEMAPEEYPSNTRGVLIMLTALVVYAYVFKPLGFVLSTVPFLFLSIVLMSKKEETNYLKFSVITVVAVLAIYLIFTRVFSIRLPRGILTFF